jgi:hypothetical protein
MTADLTYSASVKELLWFAQTILVTKFLKQDEHAERSRTDQGRPVAGMRCAFSTTIVP